MSHYLADLANMHNSKYWAGALIDAIRSGDIEREIMAKSNLERLGYILGFIQVVKDAAGNLRVRPGSEVKRRFTTEGKELIQ